MKIIHRYIFRSVLFSSLAAVGLFVFLLLAGNILKDIIGLLMTGRLNLQMFLQLMLLLIPYVVSYALPLGILTGLLMALGRLSANREVVALKSVGISIFHIATPVITVALLGVVLSALINCFYAPEAKTRYRNVLSNTVRQSPLSFVAPKTFIHEFTGYVLYVGEKSGNTLKDFWIWELDDNYNAIKLLRAREGKFNYDAKGDALILTLVEGFSEMRSARNPNDLQSIRPTVSFRVARLRLPLDRLLGRKSNYVSLSTLNIYQLMDRKEMLAEKITQLENEVDADERKITIAEKIIVQMQIQKNIAMAFSVLSLTLIGIPLGIKVSRKETYANLALALALAMGYYFLIIIVGWLEKAPHLRPDLIIWVPNLVFQATGLWLIFRADK